MNQKHDLIRSLHLQLLAAADMGLVTDRQIWDVIKILRADESVAAAGIEGLKR